ncbi:MAG: TetR/AcrR family transcriptional regulator [Lachnospiraceae bacterium]|nr:TetR/AcrR family transcriptional regulator [Lachnospiraceae bacterium]
MNKEGMNKNETKYSAASKKMQNALISLLEKKEYELITIKEICGVAGVNRSTFYLHYDNVNDLLEESMEEVYRGFFGRFGSMHSEEMVIREMTADELFFIKTKYLKPYLEFVKDNRKLFYVMYEKYDVLGGEKMYTNWFENLFGPILSKFGVSEEEKPLILLFYINGLIAMVTHWVKTGCEMSIEDMIAVIQKCIIKP